MDNVVQYFYDIYGDPIKRFIMMIQSRNICHLCNGIRFIGKEDLNEHMQGFHAEKDYKCTYCSATCSSWESFHNHIYSAHCRIFCTYCYKSYSSIGPLENHWKTHEPFNCTLCFETFVQIQSLEEHHNSMHSEVPFQVPSSREPEE